MTINTVMAIVSALLVIGALAYWVRQSFRASNEIKKAFDARVQAPTDQDLQRWRDQQQRFEYLDDQQLPAMLRRQAD